MLDHVAFCETCGEVEDWPDGPRARPSPVYTPLGLQMVKISATVLALKFLGQILDAARETRDRLP